MVGRDALQHTKNGYPDDDIAQMALPHDFVFRLIL
jgi:hypothetical protein